MSIILDVIIFIFFLFVKVKRYPICWFNGKLMKTLKDYFTQVLSVNKVIKKWFIINVKVDKIKFSDETANTCLKNIYCLFNEVKHIGHITHKSSCVFCWLNYKRHDTHHTIVIVKSITLWRPSSFISPL